MAKKFFWLKLKEDFFDDDSIEWLEEQPKGKEYSLFYLKLCLKSLKTEGILIRTVGNMLVPYDMKKLSEITKTDFDTVVVAMELLKNIGLVEVLENGEIFLPMLHEMVGSETSKAAAMRKLREQEKIQDGNNVTMELPKSYPNVTAELRQCSIDVTKQSEHCYTEIENRDRDKEIENREKEIEIKKKIEYQLIVDMYNDTCVSLPRVSKLSENRKKAIRARINCGYTTDDFQKLFVMTEKNDFLKGNNNRNWSATFDWIIKDANMAKILDGNYENRNRNFDNSNRDVLREMIEGGAFDE